MSHARGFRSSLPKDYLAGASSEDLCAIPLFEFEQFISLLMEGEDHFLHEYEIFAMRLFREEHEACSAV